MDRKNILKDHCDNLEYVKDARAILKEMQENKITAEDCLDAIENLYYDWNECGDEQDIILMKKQEAELKKCLVFLIEKGKYHIWKQ